MLETVIALSALAAATGCLLPWVREEVRVTGAVASTPLNGLHGIGIAACVGATAGLLALGHRVWRGPTRIGDAVLALAATLEVAGGLLFLTAAGQPLESASDGTHAVRLAPGLVVTAAAGMSLLLATGGAAVRRRAA